MTTRMGTLAATGAAAAFEGRRETSIRANEAMAAEGARKAWLARIVRSTGDLFGSWICGI